MSHMLQAAYLTWQQIIRGISHQTALVNSFSDVYIKPRCGGDFASNVNTSLAEMKNTMLKALEEKINHEEYRVFEARDTSHTLTVRGLCSNSSYEIAKQIAYVAVQQSNDIDSDLAFALHSLTSIFTSYQKCPENSMQTLYTIIKTSLEDDNRLEQVANQLNDKALASVKKLKGHSESPKRFYPELQQLDENEITEANMKSVLLYNELWKTFVQKFLPENNFSALDYSKAVTSGMLTDDFVEYPILQHCKKYTDIIDEYIEHAIKYAQDSLDDKTVCQIIHLLNWRNRFLKVSSMPLFVTKKNKRTPILKEEIIPLIYMHSKWLQKHLMGELFKLLPPNHKLREQFNRASIDMLQNEQDNTEIAKFSKKLRKVKGQPKLHENQDGYDLAVARSDVYKQVTLDLTKPIETQAQKLSLDIEMATDMTLALDVPDSSKLTMIQENITKMLEVARHTKISLDVKLLPINGYVIQRMLSIMKIHFIDLIYKLSQGKSIKASSGKLQQFVVILTNFTSLARVTKGFPPALLNILQVIEKLCLGTEETTTLR